MYTFISYFGLMNHKEATRLNTVLQLNPQCINSVHFMQDKIFFLFFFSSSSCKIFIILETTRSWRFDLVASCYSTLEAVKYHKRRVAVLLQSSSSLCRNITNIALKIIQVPQIAIPEEILITRGLGHRCTVIEINHSHR